MVTVQMIRWFQSTGRQVCRVDLVLTECVLNRAGDRGSSQRPPSHRPQKTDPRAWLRLGTTFGPSGIGQAESPLPRKWHDSAGQRPPTNTPRDYQEISRTLTAFYSLRNALHLRPKGPPGYGSQRRGHRVGSSKGLRAWAGDCSLILRAFTNWGPVAGCPNGVHSKEQILPEPVAQWSQASSPSFTSGPWRYVPL